jgi:L-lactate utilization protein LutB
MRDPLKHYWQIRLNDLQERLKKNQFDAYVCDSTEKAAELVSKTILPQCAPKSIAWGGSQTFVDTGLYATLSRSPDYEVVDTFDKSLPVEQMLERRRRALLSDLFITGTNAVTANGQLVNLDMIGNRTGAIAFGPHWVIVLVGRNKIAADVQQAMRRVKQLAAPANAMRLAKQTPCVTTGQCQDCSSPERICNTWTLTEKSFPAGRIKVVLINADLGL